MDIEWYDVKLDIIVNYFAKGFERENHYLSHYEYFVDPVKKTVIFRTFWKEKDK
jgi:hypothetical protein